jgi:hypothetical protein
VGNKPSPSPGGASLADATNNTTPPSSLGDGQCQTDAQSSSSYGFIAQPKPEKDGSNSSASSPSPKVKNPSHPIGNSSPQSTRRVDDSARNKPDAATPSAKKAGGDENKTPSAKASVVTSRAKPSLPAKVAHLKTQGGRPQIAEKRKHFPFSVNPFRQSPPKEETFKKSPFPVKQDVEATL